MSDDTPPMTPLPMAETNPLHPGRCCFLTENGWLQYECPGCGGMHSIPVDGSTNDNGAKWSWNGNFVQPTVKPSVNASPNDDAHRCHHWLTDGVVIVLSDSAKNGGQSLALTCWDSSDDDDTDDEPETDA